ncbi:MAG: transglycosylase SLT domain-containing protein [Bryobacteraceae bacterium]
MSKGRLFLGFLLLASLLAAAPARKKSTAKKTAPASPPPQTAHAKPRRPTDPHLASLAAGIQAYQENRTPEAARHLDPLRGKLLKVDDYVSFHLGGARLALQDYRAARDLLERVITYQPESPFLGQAILLQAKTLTESGKPEESLRLLSERAGDTPQPSGELAFGNALLASSRPAEAAAHFQRVYYEFPASDQAAKASDALAALRRDLGAAYPQPVAALEMNRAASLLEARQYGRARSEFLDLADRLKGSDHDLALVRAAAADYLQNRIDAARQALESLSPADPEVEAERLHYLHLCAVRRDADRQAGEWLGRLARKHSRSPWRLKALLAFTNRYFVQNEPERYEPLYRACAESFPDSVEAPLCHWRMIWVAHRKRDRKAPELFREHVTRYPGSSKASAALYFLGRFEEKAKRPGAARLYYEFIGDRFPNYYYAYLARERMRQPALSRATPDPDAQVFLTQLPITKRQPLDFEAQSSTRLRIERSRLLTEAGLPDLAMTELRFGAKRDGQPAIIAVELARLAESPARAMRHVKSLVSDYFALEVDQAPDRLWKFLFPLPYREELWQNAEKNALDPYLVAGLIRQESEFDPHARSRSNALGLTQVLPSTGRGMARRAGLKGFSSSMLYQPSISLRLGTLILRSMLDSCGGKVEQTLASYNAGPSRAATWTTWGDFEEPAEFVETIPFNETRDYVQAVLRNAGMYRKLYGAPGGQTVAQK